VSGSEPVGRFTTAEFVALLGSADEAVLGIDDDGRVTFATAPIRELTGEEPTYFVGERLDDLVGRDPADDPGPGRAVGGAPPGLTEWRPALLTSPAGARWKVEVVEIPSFGPLGPTVRLLLVRSGGRSGSVEDELRRRIEHEHLLERLSSTFVRVPAEQFGEGVDAALEEIGTFLGADRVTVWRTDRDGQQLVAARVWARRGAPLATTGVLRVAGSEMIRRLREGQLVRIDRVEAVDDGLRTERTLLERRGIRSMLAAPLMVEGVFSGFVSLVNHREGSVVDGGHVTVMRSAAGILAEAFARDEAERELLRRARRDPLTGLANRWAAIDALHDALVVSRRSRGLAVMLFDLDRFKALNDALGHSTGDQLLRAVADRLLAAATSEVLVARLGGDELVVVAEGLVDVDAALGLARELQMAMSAPFSIDGHDLFVTASVGCVHVRPSDAGGGPGPEEVLGWADAAMYRAKERGRNRIEVFDDRMLAAADERMRIERELRHALDASELEVHYQPEVGVTSGAVEALEAFVRWRHPREGLLDAERFVPVAAESDLVVDLGRWVLRAVGEQIARWRHQGIDTPVVRVNVSAREIADPDVVAAVAAELERWGLEPSAICVEISETALMAEPAVASVALVALDTIGVPTSVDGFGVGHSSLAHLAHLPVGVIGIDRSFASGLVGDDGGDGPDLPIVRAMVEVARALGRSVRVAGVETDAQLARVEALGCDTVQGHLLGRPAAAAGPPGG
jgi:diguanylate cyclase (GGDEF)-like protein